MIPKRKFIAVYEDLAEQIMAYAQLYNKTVPEFMNDLFIFNLKIFNLGETHETVLDKLEIWHKINQYNLFLIDENIIYESLNVINDDAKKGIYGVVKNTGIWYGKYFLQNSEDYLNDFISFIKLLHFNASDVILHEMNNKNLSIYVNNSNYSLEFTNVLSMFIINVITEFGYKLMHKNITNGIIQLFFLEQEINE